MGQAAKARRASWRAHYRHVLDLIFEEHAAQEIIVVPDEAVLLMEELTKHLFETILRTAPDGDATASTVRFDYDAYRREAHHYAVDRFYKTYFQRKRGAPPLPTAYVDRIIGLRLQGLNYVAIAEKLGQPKGRMRKQVPAAERRWLQAVEKIEQLKQRSPHLVFREPAVNVRKQRTRQAKRQTTKRQRGK